MYTRLITVLLVLCSYVPSIFAAQARLHAPSKHQAALESSGLVLVELLVGLAEGERRNLKNRGLIEGAAPHIPALVPGSIAESYLVADMDANLNSAFQLFLLQPDEEAFDHAVQVVYYVFMKHVGSAILNSDETADLLKREIRRFIQPKPGSSEACELRLVHGLESRSVH